jgi:hypothetical protein
MAEKQKVIFLRQWSLFLFYLFPLVPGPMTEVIIQGKSGNPLEH